ICAGTVVEPVGPTSAGIDSVTSTSRSVALKVSFDFSALINTLARTGMVLRRSTTRWTWPSDFSSAARSTGTFIFQSARSRGKAQKGVRKVARARVFRKGEGTGRRQLPNGFGRGPGLPFPLGTREKLAGKAIHREANRRTPSTSAASTLQAVGRLAPRRTRSLLQLPFQQFDLFGQRGIGAHEILDLAHGVQHRRMVATAEAPPDLRQRAQRQRLGEIHGHLPRTNDICRAPR